MKKCLCFLLLLGNVVCWAQKEKIKNSEYSKMSTRKLIEISKTDIENRALQTVLSNRYHEISEERFMTITQSYWDKSEMDYMLYDYAKVKDICKLNDNTDADHSYTYIKFNPKNTDTASDIEYTPIVKNNWEKTSSCFIIDLFDLLSITMAVDDVMLLTKGYEFIQVSNPTPTPSKPYIYKRTTVVLFEILNSKGESKGFYDISKDPGL